MFRLLLLLALVSIASYINHIDDTDETYGYWEPLHYLTYQLGMQTWEYCPEYAIRTYAFILPFLPFTMISNFFGLPKITVFVTIKNIIGFFFAISCRFFLKSVHRNFGASIETNIFYLLIFSPGIFFLSTSYLPSAICSSLILFSFGNWLENSYLTSIFIGSIAVLWSGWPFVGVIFLPIGLHMLYSIYTSHHDKSFTIRVIKVTQFMIFGIIIVIFTALGPLLIDSFMYGKLTFPPLNIALYNAFGGTGDELYGTEPASYYILNLILMLGPVTFILSLLGAVLILFVYLFQPLSQLIISTKLLILLSPAILWLGIMFSRPHKEERFLYPIYSLLITMAAVSLQILVHIYETLIQHFFSVPPPASSQSSKSSKSESSLSKIGQFLDRLKYLLVSLVFFLAFLAGISRVAASYRNYGGYMKLWKSAYQSLTMDLPSQSNITHQNTLCMGGDWYTFPSHFFLPSGTKLAYVEDTFHGLLPQHFISPYGSSIPSFLPVNDQNKEELSRYIPLEECHLLVMSTPTCLLTANSEETLSKECYNSLTPLQKRLSSRENGEFIIQQCEKIIDPKNSFSSLGRAYEIPFYSFKTNQFMNYCYYFRIRRFSRNKSRDR